MFCYNLTTEEPYRLVSVLVGDKIHCGTYFKSDDEESITCLSSGEKFFRISDFMDHHFGMKQYDINADFAIYDPYENRWDPLMMYIR
jgi:hypothetical protein